MRFIFALWHCILYRLSRLIEHEAALQSILLCVSCFNTAFDSSVVTPQRFTMPSNESNGNGVPFTRADSSPGDALGRRRGRRPRTCKRDPSPPFLTLQSHTDLLFIAVWEKVKHTTSSTLAYLPYAFYL